MQKDFLLEQKYDSNEHRVRTNASLYAKNNRITTFLHFGMYVRNEEVF